MSDLISRQAAIDAINGLPKWIDTENGVCLDYADVIAVLSEHLPPAQPEPLTVTIDHEPSKDECDRLKQAMRDAPILLLPSAQPKQRWIPCSERLPEANGRYLVTRGLNACGAMWNRTYLINYSDLMGIKSERIWWDGNVGKSDFQKIDDVIAWCELPEPWRGEEHDKG